jgi:hypothetical protein
VESTQIKMFFSCSFSEEDTKIVQFISSICRGLNITPLNVDRGYDTIPPEKAKEIMKTSSALIAVAVRRHETKEGSYIMPSAIREEITMAYAMEKPILLFAESDVKLDGFINNYCTHLSFDRNTLLSDFKIIEKIVASIHEHKLKSITAHDILLSQGPRVSHYTETFNYSQSLECSKNEYYWEIGVYKEIVFYDNYIEKIREMHWAAYPIPGNKPVVDSWKIIFEKGSKDFCLKVTEDRSIKGRLSLFLEIDPKPEKGDTLVYSGTFKSRHITPIFREDAASCEPCLKLPIGNFFCDEGIVPMHRINNLKTQFKFPKFYWDKMKSVIPIAGHYSNHTDSLSKEEIKRMNYRTDIFGNYISITCDIDHPLTHHSYGLAWNPPQKKEIDSKLNDLE